MKPQAALRFTALISLWAVVGAQPPRAKTDSRTALPWLLLLSYPLAAPAAAGVPLLPGIPIRRPQDEPTITTKLPASSVQSDEMPDPNEVIRQQFLQGLLQGLQSMSGGPTIQPAVLADLLQQVTTTKPPQTSQKEAKRPIIDESQNDNDPDYDYIDFKNGSRIKYELDNDQQLTDSQYANKTPFQSSSGPVPGPSQAQASGYFDQRFGQ